MFKWRCKNGISQERKGEHIFMFPFISMLYLLLMNLGTVDWTCKYEIYHYNQARLVRISRINESLLISFSRLCNYLWLEIRTSTWKAIRTVRLEHLWNLGSSMKVKICFYLENFQSQHGKFRTQKKDI